MGKQLTAAEVSAFVQAANNARSSGSSKEDSISAGSRAIGIPTGGTTKSVYGGTANTGIGTLYADRSEADHAAQQRKKIWGIINGTADRSEYDTIMAQAQGIGNQLKKYDYQADREEADAVAVAKQRNAEMAKRTQPSFSQYADRSEYDAMQSNKQALEKKLDEVNNSLAYAVTVDENDALQAQRKDILDRLHEIDRLSGETLKSYDARERAGNVVTGATDSTASSYVNLLGTGAGVGNTLNEASRVEDRKVASSDYAGWATDELTAGNMAGSISYGKMKENEQRRRDEEQRLYDIADSLSYRSAEKTAAAKEGLGTVGKFGVDLTQQFIQQGIDAGGRLLGLGMLPFFARAAGGAMGEARQAGASSGQQLLYGFTVGGIEAAIEKVSGSNKLFGKGVLDKAILGLADKAKSPAVRSAVQILLGGISEGGEEVLSDILNPFAKLIYNNDAIAETWADRDEYKVQMLQDFLIGAAMGLVGEGVSSGVNSIAQNTQQSASDIPGNIQTPPAEQNAPVASPALFNTQVNATEEAQKNTAQQGAETTAVDDNPNTHTPEQMASIEEYKNSVDTSMVNYIERVRNGEKLSPYNVAPVTNRAASDILRLTGKMTYGNTVVLDKNGIEHIDKRHGGEKGSADATMKNAEDIARIGYVLNNYDDAYLSKERAKGYLGSDGKTAPKVVFVKKIDGTYIAVEAVCDTKSKKNYIVSAFISSTGTDRLKIAEPQQTSNTLENQSPEVYVRNANAENSATSTIPNSDQNVNGNVLETGYIVPTQTHGSDSLYTESERLIEGLRPEDSVHVRHSDASVDQEATRRYNADAAGEKTDLFESGEAWTDADTALAHRFLSEAVEKARESGDYSEVVKMQREWERQGTTTGQALRQRGRFINTPENIVAESAAVIYGDKETTRKLRPKQKAEIMDNVVKYANEYNKIQKGDTTSVINMIKRMNEVRKTTGLLSSTTSKQMSLALEVASKYPDGETFLRDVLATQIRSVASDYARPSTLNQIKQIRFNNMLSKLGTIVRNLGSNNVLDPMEAISSNIAIPLDMFLSKFTGTRSVALDAWFFSKAKRQGTAEGFVKSYIQVGLDADIGDVSSKYEQSKGRTFKMTGNFFERFLSTWEKYENYGLKTTDEAQKGGIRAESQRGIDALKAKGKIAEDSLSGRAKDIALDRTLQKQGVTAKALLGIRKGLNYVGVKDKQGGELGAGDILAPFAQVPANATAKAIQYTPYGIVESGIRLGQVLYNAKNGTLTPEMQADFVTSVGRSLNAIGLVALSTALALKGFVIVAGDDDKDKEASERTQGINGTRINVSAMLRWLSGGDSSIRNGDTFIDIGYLQNLNTSIIMGSAIADAYKEDGRITLGEIANANAEALLQAITEFPAMSTLSNMIDAYNYSNAENTGGKLWDAATGFAAETATSFVIPNALRGIATGTDNKVRNTYTADTRFGQAVDSAKGGIPFLRQTLPVSVDNWGKDKEYTGDALLNFMNSNILPGQITHYKTNEIMDELGRLSDSGIDNLYPNRYAPNAVRIENETVQLTSEQRETFQRTYGSLVDSYYNEFINSSSYGMLTDDQRAEVFKNLESLATDRAKVGLENSAGSKYDSSLDDEASLSDIPAYYSYSAIMRDAADKKPTTDWQSVMKMMQNFTSLPDDVKTELKGKSDMHLKAVEYATNNGLSPEDWYSTYDVIKDAKVSTGSEAQLVSAIAINGTNKNLSDIDKLKMLQSQLPLAKDGSIPTIVRRYDVAMNRYGISFDDWTKFETELKDADSTSKWSIRSAAQSVGINQDDAVKIYKTLYDDPKYTAQVNEEFLYLNPVDESGEVEPMSFTEYYNSFNEDQAPQETTTGFTPGMTPGMTENDYQKLMRMARG